MQITLAEIGMYLTFIWKVSAFEQPWEKVCLKKGPECPRLQWVKSYGNKEKCKQWRQQRFAYRCAL